MTIDELEKKMAELDDLRVELREQIKEMKKAMVEEEKLTPPHPRWKPKNGETYFCLSTRGYLSKDKWFDTAPYEDAYRFGNLFLSAEDATFAAERLKVLAEMQEWAGNWDDGYNLRYDEIRKIETISQALPHKSYGEIRFATREDAENCIKAVGEDRIRKYYFMIPEDKSNA